MIFGPGEARAEFRKLDFPRTKDTIEAFIVRGYLSAAQKKGLLPSTVEVSQNKQDDFDFLLRFASGTKKYLELMELAPLEQVQGAYEAASASYKPYDFARYIMTKIMRKSERYKTSAGDGIFLLTYITDWRFDPSETLLALLQYWSLQEEHCFEAIHCYSPIMADNGIVRRLYPTPREFWKAFDPEACRDSVTHNLNPAGWRSG
jgi:hypothetical protein